jgi:hypothetical protein
MAVKAGLTGFIKLWRIGDWKKLRASSGYAGNIFVSFVVNFLSTLITHKAVTMN